MTTPTTAERARGLCASYDIGGAHDFVEDLTALLDAVRAEALARCAQLIRAERDLVQGHLDAEASAPKPRAPLYSIGARDTLDQLADDIERGLLATPERDWQRVPEPEYTPGLVGSQIPESSDVVSSCANCGDERDEPHTWMDCAIALQKERIRLVDILVEHEGYGRDQRSPQPEDRACPCGKQALPNRGHCSDACFKHSVAQRSPQPVPTPERVAVEPSGKDCPRCGGGLNQWGHTPACHEVQRVQRDRELTALRAVAAAARDHLRLSDEPAPSAPVEVRAARQRLRNDLAAIDALLFGKEGE